MNIMTLDMAVLDWRAMTNSWFEDVPRSLIVQFPWTVQITTDASASDHGGDRGTNLEFRTLQDAMSFIAVRINFPANETRWVIMENKLFAEIPEIDVTLVIAKEF
jgi:hypothetical protein